ncbi:ChbG/HpnK family deacetylase [Georgenia sp. SYP-B2076]|uniref:ChbG/HpnK family deacetylase n=1 Tax=Georgenia sp. SYP-B2076 TaxID=2495881 RepID=UPI0013DF45EF|nr:ChbG/HpnK family deacetylase [Georgenia sp. SYP-B2076]
MTRHLVVTADDLGLDADTNRSIVGLMREGLVTATTLITVAPAAADAVRRVLAANVPVPNLHVTLTSAREFRPWRPLAPDVASLTDASGAFHIAPARVGARASADDVVREMAAQLRWMHTAALRPAVLDSHSGSLYGVRGRSFLSAALDFSAEHGLGFRLPRRLPGLVGCVVPRRLRRRYEDAVAGAEARGVRLPETMVSSWLPGTLVLSYAQLRASVLAQLRRLPEGVSELMLHPAPPSAARRLHPAEGRKRVWELRLLRDPLLARTLRRERIELVPAW